jgi:magnesium transporter
MMRLASLLGPDLRQTLAQEPEALREALEEFHEEDIAEIAEDLPLEDVITLMRVLPHEFAAGVLERIPDERRVQILEQLKPQEAAALLVEMAPDDRADVVQTLQVGLRHSLLQVIEKVDPEIAEETRDLAAYPRNTAGGIMTTSFVGLGPEDKVWQAIDEVRRLSHMKQVEHAYYVYVLAYGRKLVGVVSLRDLILAEPGQTLADVMHENVVRVLDTDDQAEVARTIAKYDFQAVPVVEESGRMLGVITVDDVVDVVIEEATEDVQKLGAVSPMTDTYFGTGFLAYWRLRVVWLVILFLGGFLTANVMEGFEGDLSRAITLAIFIPLIISTGGNAGSQSASLVIRALAVQEVRPSDWVKVATREAVVGIGLGLVVGVLGFGRAFFAADDPAEAVPLALVVASSILLVVTVGSLLGSLLPLLIQRVGLDPAVSSTPFIASLSDVVGLLIYLSTARALLHLP